jgi:preprotein translocase SecE subunit
VTNQPTEQSKKRKLRAASETVRERGERGAAHNTKIEQRSRLKSFGGRISGLPIWKPFRFVARYIIPPYFRQSWRELRQVTWPNRKQTRQLTGAVIIFSVVFGIVVAAFDYGLDKLFKQVIVK